MVAMSPDTRPNLGEKLKDIRFDANARPSISKFSDWVLVEIDSGSLVFGQNNLPTAALALEPSDTLHDRDHWSWPTVIRGQPIWQHIIGTGGNYLETRVIIDEVPEQTLPTFFLTEIWWTTEPWPLELLKTKQPLTSPVVWGYPGARGSRQALHETIDTPPLTITSIRGQTAPVHIPSRRFPGTDFKHWTRYVVSDKQPKIRGRYRRERRTAIPPYDSRKYPNPPFDLSS